MLSVKGLNKTLGELSLTDVSFEVERGQYFVLLGASGVGKTVLLETIAGLQQTDSGQILLGGNDITNARIQRRKTALVFQQSTLFGHMTVFDNVAYPLHTKNLGKSQIRRRVDELAEDFGIDNLLKRRPATLSGGETQRVSLARAIAARPECLLLDEPLSSLDVKARPAMRNLLRNITAELNIPIVHVTHDYVEAASLGSNIAVLEDGTIAQSGTAAEVFQRPKSEFVARFVGIRNFFKGRLNPSQDSHVANSFTTAGLHFWVLAHGRSGPGFLLVRSEDVIISNQTGVSSARNNFTGKVVEIIPAVAGVEVIVDIGLAGPLEIAALVTAESVESLKLDVGRKVSVSFKASAAKFVEQ